MSQLKENELLPICCNRNDFDDLGPGIPLYFETLIYCIIMLLIILLIQGLYSLISNYYTNDCLPENAENEAVCQRDFINIISISNKFRHHGLYKFQSFVNLVSMIVVIISLHYYRIFQKRSAEEIDRDNISPSDYTIMITGLPKGGYHEALVEKTVWEFWNRIPQEQGYANKEDVITKIVLAYDIVEFVSLSRERKKLFLEKRRFDHERKNHGKKTDELKIAEIQRKLNFIEDKIKKEEGDVESGIRNKTCGIAFVSFRTQKIRKEFMERVEIGVCQRIGDFIKEKVLFCWKLRLDRFHLFEDKNVRLKVQKAAEPDEIIWENLGYNEKYRRNARHKTHFLTTIVLCICFSVIFGISYLQVG